MNGEGKVPGWNFPMLPLSAVARFNPVLDIAVWLLSRGADPNGSELMSYSARESPADMLQLLIDAGGVVNGSGIDDDAPPLFCALESNSVDRVRVLLAQPCLEFTIDYYGSPTLEAMVVQEVSRGSPAVGVWFSTLDTPFHPGCRGVLVLPLLAAQTA